MQNYEKKLCPSRASFLLGNFHGILRCLRKFPSHRKKVEGILDGFQNFLTQLCAKIVVFGRFIPNKHRRKGGLHHTAKKLLVQTERCECVYKRAALANDAFLRKGGTVEQAYDFLLKIIASETCSDAASLRGFSLRYFFKITAPSPFFPSGKNAYAKVRISF